MAVIHATEYDAAERQFAKAVGELESADQLLALLDERHPAYTEQPAAVVTRMRAWVLLALSRAAELPAAALPFVLEELETPHDPYLVAVAAICLRHYAFPHPSFADALCQALLFAKARDYQDRLMPLHDALFCETSPAPVKYAVSLLGRGSEEVRLPLAEASEAARAQVKKAMQGAGIIN